MKSLQRAIAFTMVAGLVPLAAPAIAAADLDSRPDVQSPDAADASEPEKRVRREVIRVRRDGEDPAVWVFRDGEAVEMGAFGRRGYLGVGILSLNPELRQHFGAPAERGVMVSKVVADSPAAAAGLAVGDILLSVDGVDLERERDLVREIGRQQEGGAVTLEVLRDGNTFPVTATVEERERREVDLMPFMHLGKDWSASLPDLPDGEAMARLMKDREKDVERIIAIREKDIESAMGDLERRLSSPEFRQRIEEAARRSADLERRTAELEQRLAELQRQLQRLQPQQAP